MNAPFTAYLQKQKTPRAAIFLDRGLEKFDYLWLSENVCSNTCPLSGQSYISDESV